MCDIKVANYVLYDFISSLSFSAIGTIGWKKDLTLDFFLRIAHPFLRSRFFPTYYIDSNKKKKGFFVSSGKGRLHEGRSVSRLPLAVPSKLSAAQRGLRL